MNKQKSIREMEDEIDQLKEENEKLLRALEQARNSLIRLRDIADALFPAK